MLKRRLLRIAIWTVAGVAVLLLALLGVAHLPFTAEAKRQAFYEAAEQGDINAMTAFINGGMKANTWLRPETPRYMWVIRRIENDPEYLGMKRPVILGAVASKKISAVQLLLDHGADINACGPDGTTPLMEAGYANDAPMVQFLLAHGGDPYCCWKDGSVCDSDDPSVKAILNSARENWKGSKQIHRGHHEEQSLRLGFTK